MKLQSVQVRISDDNLVKLDAIARQVGQSRSGAIRLLIESEAEDPRLIDSIPMEEQEKMEEEYQKIQGRYGEAVKLLAPDGREFHFYVCPYRSICVALLLDTENDTPDYKSLKGTAPIFDQIIELFNSADYDWDTPAFREVCLRLGIDPDEKRPKFKAEDEEIAATLHKHFHKFEHFDLRRHFILDLIELLRTDLTPEISMYDDVKRNLQNLSNKERLSIYDEALARIDTTRLTSTKQMGTVITFLPSWAGRGYNASINLWSSDPQEDGWPKTLYRHVTGVARLPVGELTITQKTAIRRLKEQGVTFLNEEEAEEYLRGEGAYWKWYHSVPAPTEERMQHPVLDRTLAWIMKYVRKAPKPETKASRERPATPLYDAWLARKSQPAE